MKTPRFLKLSGLFLLLLIKVSLVCAQQEDINVQRARIGSMMKAKVIPAMPMNNNESRSNNKNGNSIASNTTPDTALNAVERANINNKIKAEITKAVNMETSTQNITQLESKQNTTTSIKPSQSELLLQPTPSAEVLESIEPSSVLQKTGASTKQPKPEDIPVEKQQEAKDIDKTPAKSFPKKKKTKKVAVTKTIKEMLPEDWSEGSQNTRLAQDDAKELPGVKTIPFTNNERLNVALSNKDVNRIVVKGDKIQAINGPSGYYFAKNDQQGAAYINTFGESPFTLFISTLRGYSASLLVHPTSLPGKTIILLPRSQSDIPWEQSDSYQKSLVTLMTHMINNTETEDYEFREVKKAKIRDFYNVAQVKTLAIYDGSYLYGTISVIKNISRNPITLKPSYFYEPGVRAVALAAQTLHQGESGLMYRVMGR